MTLPADPVAAVLTYLRTDPDLLALVGDRIYGAGRPESGPASLPAPALTLTPVGGGGGGGGRRTATSRWLTWRWRSAAGAAWASTAPFGPWPSGAPSIAPSTSAIAWPRTPRLLWAVEVSGPALLRDPDTQEPFVRCGVRAATADD